MRNFCLDRQRDAYSSLAGRTSTMDWTLFNDCKDDWTRGGATDWSMVKFWYERQVRAKQAW